MAKTSNTTHAPRHDKAKLLDGPVGPTLWHLSWPMTVGLISIIAFNVIDTFYIGKLGSDPLAAMGFCFPVIFGVGAMAIGMGNGAVALVARTIGAGDMKTARRLITNTMIITSLISLTLTLLMQIISDPLFAALGAPKNLMPYINDYMDVWYGGMILMIAPIVANGLIRSNGASVFPSILMLVAAALNAVISPLLIFGLLGAPELGMAGAAWATLLARSITLLCGFYYLARHEKLMSFEPEVLTCLPDHARQIFRFGAPAVISQMVAPFSTGVITRIMASYGPEAVAGFAVGMRVETLFIIPFFAFQSGIGPFVGQNAGARQIPRVIEAERWTWRFSVLWGSICMVCMVLFGAEIGALFSHDPDIIQFTDRFLMYSGLGFIGAGLLQSSSGMYTPLGMPIRGAMMSGLRTLGLYVPLAWALSQGIIPGFSGPDGAFAAAGISWIIAGLVSAGVIFRLLRSGKLDIPAPILSATNNVVAPLSQLPDQHPASTEETPAKTAPATVE